MCVCVYFSGAHTHSPPNVPDGNVGCGRKKNTECAWARLLFFPPSSAGRRTEQTQQAQTNKHMQLTQKGMAKSEKSDDDNDRYWTSISLSCYT